MNHDKRSAGISGITDDALQIQNVAFGQVEVVADSNRRMDMYRQMQPPALANQIPKNIVLKCSVFLLARNAATNEALINVLSLLSSRIRKFCRSKIGDFEFLRDRAFLLIVL